MVEHKPKEIDELYDFDTVELTPEELEPNLEYGMGHFQELDNLKAKDLKIRITGFLRSDVLDILKKEAEETKSDYWDLINDKLAELLIK